MPDNRLILLTGGTGSFGYTFVLMMLVRYNLKREMVFLRDETKQWESPE